MVDRIQKQEAVSDMKVEFESAGSVIVVHYRGITVEEMNEFRSKARENGANVRITKNTLAKIAANDTQFKNIADLFSGPTAIAFSDDEVGAAKAVSDFAKENEKLVIIGGAFGDNVLDESGVNSLAKTPSLDESRGKLVGLLQAPAEKLARILNEPAGKVARVLSARAVQ